jgi:predicted RNase H-like nuclease (RuvC/YqgF family)
MNKSCFDFAAALIFCYRNNDISMENHLEQLQTTKMHSESGAPHTIDMRLCIGQIIADEMRHIVRGAAKQIMEDHEEIEDLKCKVKNYEDHIHCLEQLVNELQLMLRNEMNRESTTDESSHSPNPEKHESNQKSQRNSMLKIANWLSRSQGNIKSASSKLQYKHGEDHESLNNGLGNGSLNDFL